MPSSAAAWVKFSWRAAASKTRIAGRGGMWRMAEMISQAYHLCRAFSWRNDPRCAYLSPVETDRDSCRDQRRSDKMRDEMDARLWVEHHAEFSRSLDQLFARLKLAFAGIKPALDRIH